MSKIKIGTEVTWESQVRGHWNTKNGTVVKHLPPFTDARLHLPKGTKPSRLQTRTPESNHDRHLVKAVDKNEKIVFFTARTSTLQASLDGTYVRPAQKTSKKKKASKKVKTADQKAAKKAAGKKVAKKAAKATSKKSGKKAAASRTKKAKAAVESPVAVKVKRSRKAPAVEVEVVAKPKRSRKKAVEEATGEAEVDVAVVDDSDGVQA